MNLDWLGIMMAFALTMLGDLWRKQSRMYERIKAIELSLKRLHDLNKEKEQDSISDEV